MTTFKKGDRVRALVSAMDITKGREYTVAGMSGRWVGVVDNVGSENYLLSTSEWEQVMQPVTEFDLLSAMTGKPLKFRSGCDVKFIAYAPEAKPHCQLVLLNPTTGNIVTRYANGKASDEPHNDPGDILLKEAA
ncbi:hypothetical protein [Burkholderia multivorans]|uniref:hypothetical protein n=1 Tax=Burkholderia multivorans TaxID=87883 RepID=UPI001E37FB2C|nr:hypothetical protein [Burkholderia multivorans]